MAAPLLLAVALGAAASAQNPAGRLRGAAETVDCSRDEARGVSQDCGVYLKSIFDAVKPTVVQAHGELSGTVFRYFDKMQGVATTCDDDGTAFESVSPAASDDCGGKTVPFVVAGYGIWSMAGRCATESGSASAVGMGDVAAFVLLHEFGHLALGHPRSARADVGDFCEHWFPVWLDDPSSDAVRTLEPVVEASKRLGPAAQKKALATASLRHCVDQWNAWSSENDVPAPLRALWLDKKRKARQRENDADAFADAEMIPRYNALRGLHEADPANPIPSIAIGAGQCAMADLKLYEDALSGGLKPKPGRVSDHPDSDERAARLALIEAQMCAGARTPNSICDPPAVPAAP